MGTLSIKRTGWGPPLAIFAIFMFALYQLCATSEISRRSLISKFTAICNSFLVLLLNIFCCPYNTNPNVIAHWIAYGSLPVEGCSHFDGIVNQVQHLA